MSEATAPTLTVSVFGDTEFEPALQKQTPTSPGEVNGQFRNQISTVSDQIEKLRERFGLSRLVMVGDRGMLTQPQIDQAEAACRHGMDHGADQHRDSELSG